VFSQNLILQEAFETIAQINKEVEKMEFDGQWILQKLQTSGW